MELPKVSDLTAAEKTARVKISPRDPSRYPRCYDWPLEKVLSFTSTITAPPTKESVSKFGGASNWDVRYKGYSDWAVPWEDEGIEGIMKIMTTQSIYGFDSSTDYPEIQMKKLLAAPLERALAMHSKTEDHQELQQKIFVMKYSLAPFVTSYHTEWEDRCDDEQVRVWRLIACYGETNLDTLHDRILGPAMGWTRHYHSYRFIAPTNGACFGPKSSEAIDYMHAMTHQMYMLDSSKYQLCHVLRKPGQRLVYDYDYGDRWVHNIELIQVADKGDILELPCDVQVKKALTKHYGSTLPELFGAQLFAGEVNCPPEDSNGCKGMGQYGNLLKKGPRYYSREAQGAMNWKEHRIDNAFDFDLAAHVKRFSSAISGKSSSKLGQKICNFPLVAPDEAKRILDKPKKPGEKVKECCIGDLCKGCVPVSETIHARPDKAKEAVCGMCGRQPNIESGRKTSLMRCSGCKAAWYCGAGCQKSDWVNHKGICRKMRKERLAYKKEKIAMNGL